MEMKIALLSSAAVARCYCATLQERGHQIMIVDGHPPTAVENMVRYGVDGILILSDGDEIDEEIAARFSRATGRPVWRNLTEIPR
jgi:DNA-binding LacI/PurR family transcriptional regulator